MFHKIPQDANPPHDFYTIIEIPAHSDPVKYEVDKDSGLLRVDRFMAATMRYPCDYGYIPFTLGEDKDPLDVLVVSPVPLLSGALVRVRPIGMLKMSDESGPDHKILAVPVNELTKVYQHIQQPEDLLPILLEQITYFFEHYKDLETGKWVKVEGWTNQAAAFEKISEAFKRYIDPRYSVIFCSCPSETVATSLATLLIESKLAACVNVIPQMQSHYTWKNKIETSVEVLMMIKTTTRAFSEISQIIQKHHPYECPEIIALPIEQGNQGYLQWINETLSQKLF